MCFLEITARHPRIKSSLIAPMCHHQPDATIISWLQQLKTLKTVLRLHRTSPLSKTTSKLVTLTVSNSNSVNLYNTHESKSTLTKK